MTICLQSRKGGTSTRCISAYWRLCRHTPWVPVLLLLACTVAREGAYEARYWWPTWSHSGGSNTSLRYRRLRGHRWHACSTGVITSIRALCFTHLSEAAMSDVIGGEFAAAVAAFGTMVAALLMAMVMWYRQANWRPQTHYVVGGRIALVDCLEGRFRDVIWRPNSCLLGLLGGLPSYHRHFPALSQASSLPHRLPRSWWVTCWCVRCLLAEVLAMPLAVRLLGMRTAVYYRVLLTDGSDPIDHCSCIHGVWRIAQQKARGGGLFRRRGLVWQFLANESDDN